MLVMKFVARVRVCQERKDVLTPDILVDGVCLEMRLLAVRVSSGFVGFDACGLQSERLARSAGFSRGCRIEACRVG